MKKLLGLLRIFLVLVLQFKITGTSGSQCGMVDEDTQGGEWPFVAGLYDRNTSELFCGGTLLNSKHVLTGAYVRLTKRHSFNTEN